VIVRLLSGTVYYPLLLAAAGSLIAPGVPAAAVLAVIAMILVAFAVALQQSAVNLAATVIFLMFQPFRRDDRTSDIGLHRLGHAGMLMIGMGSLYSHPVPIRFRRAVVEWPVGGVTAIRLAEIASVAWRAEVGPEVLRLVRVAESPGS
jgi:hypothetical protein